MTGPDRDEELDAAITGHPLLGPLPADVRSQLTRSGFEYHVAPGDLLYESGRRADRVFFVLSGALQIEYPAAGDKRGYVTAVLAAPCLLGECQVFHDRHWSGTGVALTELRALGLRRADLERLMLEQSELGLGLYRELTARFLRAIDNWRHQPGRSPEQALARYLVGYVTAVAATGGPDPVRSVPMTQRLLGQATGLRRETTNRLLRKWADEGRLDSGPDGPTNIRVDTLMELLTPMDRVGVVYTLGGSTRE